MANRLPSYPSSITTQCPNKTAALPQPLFVYGTLRAMPLLAWALTGDQHNVPIVSKLVRKAVIKGYAQYTVRGKDYPAAVKDDESSCVDGLIIFPQNRSQRTKLDDFEGETYTVTPVLAAIIDSPDPGGDSKEHVDADIYVWSADRDAVSSEPWDLDTFIRERLTDWLDLFAGIELVGDA